jgi:hypothetical protein
MSTGWIASRMAIAGANPAPCYLKETNMASYIYINDWPYKIDEQTLTILGGKIPLDIAALTPFSYIKTEPDISITNEAIQTISNTMERSPRAAGVSLFI